MTVAFTHASKVPIKIELYYASAWHDITHRGRAINGLEIDRGHSAGSIQPETDQLRVTLGNDDSLLTEGNPESVGYPDIARGCPIRVSLTGILGSDAMRFQGAIDTMEADFPGGPTSTSTMAITAIGTWGVLVQSAEPLAGAVERLILADTTDLAHYWHMTDPENTVGFASAVAGGGPMLFEVAEGIYEDPAWQSASPPPGGGPDNAARLNESLVYTPDVDVAAPWSVSFAIRRPDDFVDGTPIAAVIFLLDGIETTVSITGPAAADAAGEASWWHYYVTGTQVAGDAVLSLWRNGAPRTGVTYAGQTMGTLTRLSATSSACTDDYSMAEVAVYSSASVDYQAHSDALQGWADERADVRMQRLCDEEGVDIEITGTSAITMGPQLPDTLPNLLEECALADGGLLGDGGTDGALTYLCESSMFNQAADVAIVKGALEKFFRPRWDRQDIGNDWTVSRPGGTTYRAVDTDHIAATGTRVKRSATVNVDDDAQVVRDAWWRVHKGTVAGPRYPTWGINMRNPDGAALATSVLNLTPGGRITALAAALPPQHPPNGLSLIAVGWTEYLDTDKWIIRPNAIQASTYEVHVVASTAGDGNNRGRVGLRGSFLTGGITATQTSVTVSSNGGVVWRTGAGLNHDLDIGGERVTVTAISSATTPQTFTIVRSVNGVSTNHAGGTSVQLWSIPVYAH